MRIHSTGAASRYVPLPLPTMDFRGVQRSLGDSSFRLQAMLHAAMTAAVQQLAAHLLKWQRKMASFKTVRSNVDWRSDVVTEATAVLSVLISALYQFPYPKGLPAQGTSSSGS